MQQTQDPRDLGYIMPAEWAPHSACWMAWPCREGMWANEEATQRDYANLANTIVRFEPLKMLAPAHKVAEARSMLDKKVEVIQLDARQTIATINFKEKPDLTASVQQEIKDTPHLLVPFLNESGVTGITSINMNSWTATETK